MSRFAHFLNLYFIEDIVKNLQFLFPSMKILLYFFKKKKKIGPSSTEANDTYTCFLFKLTSYM